MYLRIYITTHIQTIVCVYRYIYIYIYIEAKRKHLVDKASLHHTTGTFSKDSQRETCLHDSGLKV